MGGARQLVVTCALVAALALSAAQLTSLGRRDPAPPATVGSPAAATPPRSSRFGPLDGSHLTCVTDAIVFLERSGAPLDAAQRRRIAGMIPEYVASCDQAEDATTRIHRILDADQMVRLKSYPLGRFPPPHEHVGQVLALLQDYRPNPVAATVTPNSPGPDRKPPKMIRILQGLDQMLRDPTCNLTAEQARAAHESLESTQVALTRIRSFQMAIREVLTPAQIGLLPLDMGGAEHDRCVTRALAAWLEDGPLRAETPRWRPPSRRNSFTSDLMSLYAGLVALEGTDSLRLSTEQRREILQEVRSNLEALDAVVAARDRCALTLTRDQWMAVYSSPVEEAAWPLASGRYMGAGPTPGAPPEALEWLVDSYRRRGASGGPAPVSEDLSRLDDMTPPFIRLLEGLTYLERHEKAPGRPTDAQARVMGEALASAMEPFRLTLDANVRLAGLLTPEQRRYLRTADIEVGHEHDYVAMLLIMQHLGH